MNIAPVETVNPNVFRTNDVFQHLYFPPCICYMLFIYLSPHCSFDVASSWFCVCHHVVPTRVFMLLCTCHYVVSKFCMLSSYSYIVCSYVCHHSSSYYTLSCSFMCLQALPTYFRFLHTWMTSCLPYMCHQAVSTYVIMLFKHVCHIVHLVSRADLTNLWWCLDLFALVRVVTFYSLCLRHSLF